MARPLSWRVRRLSSTATTKDASNNVLTGRPVTWSSNRYRDHHSLSRRVVTGVSAGPAVITATSEGVNGTLTINVSAPPSLNGIVDPTLLVRATGQHPAAFTYGRTLAAGQTYADPLTGVTVLKLTDASTPSANSGMYHGYSEGGPTISQPWTGSDGQTYYTAAVGTWLVDIKYATLQTTNWRRVSFWGELGLAFSLDPATPRIAYIGNSTRVDRYNTATNQIENIGNWPWVISGGQYLDWLQVQLNDQWVVGMFDSNHTVVAFRPSGGTQRAITEADAGPIDEPHLDRGVPYIYLSTNSTDREQDGESGDGDVHESDGPSGYSDDAHAAQLRGRVVAVSWKAKRDHLGRYGGAAGGPDEDFRRRRIGVATSSGGAWVFNNPSVLRGGSVEARRGVCDLPGDDRVCRAWRVTCGCWQRTMPSEATTAPAGQPHPTLAPDGKFVMWTSNMNGSGRYDTFLARVPVR